MSVYGWVDVSVSEGPGGDKMKLHWPVSVINSDSVLYILSTQSHFLV